MSLTSLFSKWWALHHQLFSCMSNYQNVATPCTSLPIHTRTHTYFYQLLRPNLWTNIVVLREEVIEACLLFLLSPITDTWINFISGLCVDKSHHSDGIGTSPLNHLVNSLHFYRWKNWGPKRWSDLSNILACICQCCFRFNNHFLFPAPTYQLTLSSWG